MIEGISFIWLHFPKCAGTATEAALRKLYFGLPGYRFDEIDPANVIWHETIAQRINRDPSFIPGQRMVVCNFRRLPFWIISRVRFEESRPPHHAATREMMLSGRFFKNTGEINHADNHVRLYGDEVHTWIRTECLSEDFARAFGVRGDLQRANETIGPPDVRFRLSEADIERLYEACPLWADLERKLYGSLLHEITANLRMNPQPKSNFRDWWKGLNEAMKILKQRKHARGR
jgi:hypothetical protein